MSWFDKLRHDATDSKVYVIAEIGNNHNGNLVAARQLIDAAKKAGVDCVKFQLRTVGSVYRATEASEASEDLGAEYIVDLLRRFDLSWAEHLELRTYVESLDLDYLCTPWDQTSLKLLASSSVSQLKVASADFTNLPLIEAMVATGKPLILSTGMASSDEIEMVSRFLKNSGCDFALLHCNSTYPAPFEDINLLWINNLKSVASVVGYSGHERGVAVSLGAVALGAKIIEKHLTLDRSMEGPDHAASLLPVELERLVDGIRQLEKSLGSSSGPRRISQGELINRENLGKSLIASRHIIEGEVIARSMIDVKSPGQGLSPLMLEDLVGKTCKRSMSKGDFFFASDLRETERLRKSNYNIESLWGIPVRFHDFALFAKEFSPRLWEFHLSYNDLSLDPYHFLDSSLLNKPIQKLVVHTPELFENGELLDLCSDDSGYRARSIKNVKRVIAISKKIAAALKYRGIIPLVTNVGGFSMDEPVNKEVRARYYANLLDSLKDLQDKTCTVIPQTSAPFPWHFGGQRYQNLLLSVDDCVWFSKKSGLKLCVDISHTGLACNHFGWDLYDFIAKIAEYTDHFHLSDFSGVSGEGLQFGDGELDLHRFKESISNAGRISFIPEIWQGHKDFGEGFRFALQKLEILEI